MGPGDVIAGRFEIQRLAQRGGMSSVYFAHDRHSGGPVALKLLHAYAMNESQFLLHEAQVLLEVQHPGIVRYVAHGETHEDVPYLAMEWIEGVDLRRRLQRGRLSLSESVTMAQRAAEALAFAHARGVVHRDVKPSNLVLVGEQMDQVKLVDFGVARLPKHFHQDVNQEGEVIGTMAYMAPEQARGWPTVDARADVFSLGGVLFECVTHRRAFVGEDAMAVLAKVLLADPPRTRSLRQDVPRALDDLIAWMLSKEVSDRPTAAMVASALSEIASFDVSEEYPPSVRRPSSIRPPALTRGEQRLVSVMLAVTELGKPRASRRDADGRPRDDDHTLPATDQLQTLVTPFGARAEWLANGSLIAFLTGKGGAAGDQALQAARCALALRKEFPWALMALVTGRGELAGGLLIGEAIDRASHLVSSEVIRRLEGGERADVEDGLPSWPIRIDSMTAALLDARFQVGGDELGLVLQGEREPRVEARTLLGKPTPCVGRKQELALLDEMFEECLTQPRARSILVAAPAGVGKSRLCHEFLNRARKRTRCEVWVTRGDPMSKGSPFSMAAQMLRQAASLHEGEPLLVQRQKLLARVGRHTSPTEAMRIAEFLGEIVGVPFPDDDSTKLRTARQDPMVMGDQIRYVFEEFIKTECNDLPVVMVLEDLQWGDLPTLRLVDATLKSAHDQPLFVLMLGRPEVNLVFPDLCDDPRVHSLVLTELTRQASEQLAREVLGDKIADSTLSQIVDQAAGNALYLEELIRAVAEKRDNTLPETVVAMVQARIEAMEHDARRLLRAASIFGQSFWARGLEVLLGCTKADDGGPISTSTPFEMDEWLAEMCSREVIVRSSLGKFADQEEFSFRHGLVRDAAYAMLTDADRELGHALAGAWLERTGERDAAVLAEHFERGAQANRAVGFYLQAAHQALEGNDLKTALVRVECGIHCGATGQSLGMLHLLAAEALRWRGEPAAEQVAALEAMKRLPHGSARWCIAAGHAAIASGKLADIERLEAIAADLVFLGACGDVSSNVVLASARTAIPLVLAGQMDSAEKLLDLVSRVGGDMENVDSGDAAWIHLALGTHAAETGDPFTALEHMEAAAVKFDEASDIRNVCAQCINIGWTSLETGQNQKAEQALLDGIEMASRLGLHHVVTGAKQVLACALMRRGALDEAYAVQVHAVVHSATNLRTKSIAQRALADILMGLGKLEAAAEQAINAIEAASSLPPIRAYALATLADVKLRQGRVEEALETAKTSLNLLNELGGLVLGDALVRLIYAEALMASGNTEQARSAIKHARDHLLTRANKAPGMARKEAFLQHVPDNARTLSLATRWLNE